MSKSEKRQRKATLSAIRCFPEEKEKIMNNAKDCGMSTGQYMLSCSLGRQTRTKIDSMVINELRRLGGLQKHLFVQGQGGLSKEYADILLEIKNAIMRISG